VTSPERRPRYDEDNADRVAVICLGNRYMKDDGIGVRVAEELTNGQHGVVADAFHSLDLAQLANYSSASRIIIVDALKGGGRPGTVSRYSIVPGTDPIESMPGAHAMKLHEIIGIARRMKILSCPVDVVGVEPKDCSPGEGMTEELERAVPDVCAVVYKELGIG